MQVQKLKCQKSHNKSTFTQYTELLHCGQVISPNEQLTRMITIIGTTKVQMAAEAGSALIQQLHKRKGRYKMSISTTSVLHPFGLQLRTVESRSYSSPDTTLGDC